MSDHADLIARAEAALEGVTPGPWYATQLEYSSKWWMLAIDPDGSVSIDATGGGMFDEPEARFIAASRQLVPDLIAALRAEKDAREKAEAERYAARAQVNLSGLIAQAAQDDADMIHALTARAERAEAELAAGSFYKETDIDAMIARAERAGAMVAAAYRDAAQTVECGCARAQKEAVRSAKSGADRWQSCGQSNCGAEDAAAIFARTPADAQAALDWMLQQAADDALERAAVKANGLLMQLSEGLGIITADTIAAAIRAMKGGAQ